MQDFKVLRFRTIKHALSLWPVSHFIDENCQGAGLIPGQMNYRGTALLRSMKAEEEAGSEW
eukprot:8579410-Heterocapsa_arctica.AAC.1